jgi:Cu/Ag efflux protein CusF
MASVTQGNTKVTETSQEAVRHRRRPVRHRLLRSAQPPACQGFTGVTKMMSKLIPAALVLLIGSTSLAFAESTEGKIKEIDAKAMTITLEDGMVVGLPGGYKVADLKVGEKVKVEWQRKDNTNEASEIAIVK